MVRIDSEMGINDLYQPKCCAKCVYIRPYGGYKICSCPFFPAEMSILDVSSFKVNPDAVPDWCPLIKINNEIASMPEEERNALNDICKGLAILLGWPESKK